MPHSEADAATRDAEFLRRPEFNRSFELPASPADGRDKPLHFTYADFGHHDEAHPDEDNVFLFLGPMMASRMLHVAKDATARRHKVRFIAMDRPGFGGSDKVDVKHRLDVTRGPYIFSHDTAQMVTRIPQRPPWRC
jgi:pimeloyl-ACP methyl ester carboxylesterase